MKTIDRINCLVGSFGLVTACAALVVSVRSCRITQEQAEAAKNELRLSESNYDSQRTVNLKLSVSGEQDPKLSWQPVDPQFLLTDVMLYSYSGDLKTGKGSLAWFHTADGSANITIVWQMLLEYYEKVDYATLFVMRELAEAENKEHYVPAPSGYFPICADITYNYQGAKIERSIIVELYYSDEFREGQGTKIRFRKARVGRIVDRTVGCERPLREAWNQWVREAFLSFGIVEVDNFTPVEEMFPRETPTGTPK